MNNLGSSPIREVCEDTNHGVKNIHGGSTIWPNPNNPVIPFAADARGCAIFGENLQPNHFVNFIKLGLNNPMSWDFENCQKAVLVNGFTTSINDNRCVDVDGGFLQFKCENNTQQVLNNIILNTYLGVGTWGNSSGGGISNNNITVKAHPYIINPNYGSHFWGKGIELGYYSNAQMAWMAAFDNTITSSEPEWIIGLNVYNSLYGHRARNAINFTSTSNQINTSFTLPALRGICLSNSLQNDFEENIITGTFQSGNINRRSTAVWIHRSRGNYFTCNTLDRTRYGFYVVGNNHTGNSYAIVGNLLNPYMLTTPTHEIGFVFRHLSTEATLGNIGDLQHDNNNTFGLLSAYTSGYKVFKFCNVFQNDYFYTNPLNLNPSESGSTNSCGYFPQNNSSTYNEYECAQGGFVPVKKFKLDEAMDIAEDSVLYPEFQPLAEWMDENDLYHQLLHDSTMRYSNTVLEQFFNLQHQDATRYIAEANDLIEALAQDITGMSAIEYQNLLAEAEQQNMMIQSMATPDNNEREINRIYLYYLKFGLDSISTADAAMIENIATQCPYVAGTAVFKARSLFALYQPGYYVDDMALCNSVGVYKNGNGLFDDENEILDNLHNQVNTVKEDYNLIQVYPNPTRGIVNITSKESFGAATWTLKDVTGRSITRGHLTDNAYTQQIIIPQISTGVYHLHIENKGKFFISKLIIE